MSIVDDHESVNTKKWIELYQQEGIGSYEKFHDIIQWKNVCKKQCYKNTDVIKIYGELPPPKDDKFPFENEVLQWMGNYVIILTK